MIPRHLKQWEPFAFASGTAHDVSPFLVLAIIDRESLGGLTLTPVGPMGTGDKGNGLGLMQIDRRYHRAWADERTATGLPLWQDGAANIEKGTTLLRENLDRFNGLVEAAAAAYNASGDRVRDALARLPVNASETRRILVLDRLTTKTNYVSDVLARMQRFSLPTLARTP